MKHWLIDEKDGLLSDKFGCVVIVIILIGLALLFLPRSCY